MKIIPFSLIIPSSEWVAVALGYVEPVYLWLIRGCIALSWFVSRVQKIEVSYKIRNGMLIFYFSWNKQRTVDYTLYVNYTAYSFEAMEMEFNRFITWPDKLAHTKLEISRWRTFWKSRNRIMTLYFYIFDVFTISIFCSFQNWKYCTCQHFLLMVCMTWFQLN